MHMDDLEQLVDLARRAVAATLAAVGRSIDQTRPTPCAGWDVGGLMAHMTVQQHGFARAVAGAQTAVADWEPRRAAGAPEAVDAYADACAQVLAAFAAVRDPAAPVLLPEIRDEPVPAGTAIGFHLVDNVVHAWDTAASLGRDVDLDDDVLGAALVVARLVPDGAERSRPGAAFAPGRPAVSGSAPLDEILLLLGRDPSWAAA